MTAIYTLISCALVWWLFAFLWRDYRLDRYRQNLFVIRDELFDFAYGGNISFDTRAYGMLRTTINGNIRYGHRLGLFEVLMFGLLGRSNNIERYTESYAKNWQDALSQLDEPTRTQMQHFRHRIHLEIGEQVVFTSFTLVFTSAAFVLFFLLRWAGRRIHDAVFNCINRFMSSGPVCKIVERMDATAYMTKTH